MKWTYPETLWILLLLLPLTLLPLLNWLRFRGKLPVFFGTNPKSKSAMTSWLVQKFFRDFFLLVFVVLVIFAAADPQGGRKPFPELSQGLDMVLVMDVSRSMLAEDMEPNRLGKAISTARLLSRSLGQTRYSLVPFKGEAFIAVPMTEDRVVLDSWFNRLGPGISTVPGTNLEAALRQGREAFPPGRRQKILVLFSDGEHLEGRVEKVAREMALEGIVIHTVAVGSSQGSPIRLPDASYIKDSKDMIVLSKANTEILKRLAEETYGTFTDLNKTGAAAILVKEVKEQIDFTETKGIQFRSVSRYRSFLIPGLLFLLAAFFLSMISWGRKS